MKNLIKMLTFRQLTLQFCHHSVTQFHSHPPQFIQNPAPIHCQSHHLYARDQNPWKVYTQCFRNWYLFDQPSYFCQFERENNAIGSDRVLSFHGKEAHFETGFSLAVFSKTTKAEFIERGPCSAGCRSLTTRNKGLALGSECVNQEMNYVYMCEYPKCYMVRYYVSKLHLNLAPFLHSVHRQKSAAEGREAEMEKWSPLDGRTATQ